ncbi:MAG: response regulator [Mobilitalea sp.]
MLLSKVEEIAQGIYWVGSGEQIDGLNCNPYLIVDGEEAVLIDPGSPLDFDRVYENICSIIPLDKIKYVILHHQDPDFCSAVPLLEQKGANFTIVTHWRTQTIVKYYGIKSKYYLVDKNNFQLVLESGRTLQFIQTPYLHFAGAITTYDIQSKTLFSSDLFGAFSYRWTLFADKNYMEQMKTFHEHYMPSNEILHAAMEMFLKMDIDMIASQHGSIIKDYVHECILTLRDLECGSFLKPVRKQLIKTGKGRFFATSIIKRLISIYGKEEVLEVFQGLEMTIDENFEVIDYKYTGTNLINIMMDRMLSIKGLQWIILLEPYIKALINEYDLHMPLIYESRFTKIEKKAMEANEENEILREINSHLENNLTSVSDTLVRCPITGVYNYDFFRKYADDIIAKILEEESEQNPGLIIISPDNMGRIRYSYGENEVDDTLRNMVYLLDSLKIDSDLIFRLRNTQFAFFSQHTTKEKTKEFAELIRNEVFKSKKFIEPMTVSIGIVTLDEVRKENDNNLEENFYETAAKRLNQAKKRGKNNVYSEEVTDAEGEEAGAEKIMLVDTDIVNIEVLKNYLENEGYQVISAKDGEEAWNIAENEHIDLIASEVMLPKMDGFVLREKLLQGSLTKRIPFMIVSYLKDNNSVQRSTMLGIEHYFKKPFMLTEFIGVVNIIVKGDANR